MQCSLESGKKKCKSKPLTELFVKGQFTEDREEWQKQLQRHCEEVCTDLEETKEVQECRIQYFKKKGNQQFTEEGRKAEITVELVLQARDNLSDNKVKSCLWRKSTLLIGAFKNDLGQMGSPSSWKVVKLVFLKKPDAATTKGIGSHWAIALTSEMSKCYASCVLLRLEKERGLGKFRSLHIGGVNGISCQYLQALTTNLLQKHGERQEERNPVMRHGTVVRPAMYLASLDIRTAFDEAKPKHVAWILDDHNTHGWLIAALLREMSELSGTASFESVESRFSFRCLRQGSVEAPRLLQKMASQILANVEEEWMMKRKGVPMDVEEGVHQICSFMSRSKEHLEQMLKDLLEEAGKVDLEPKPASLWWTSTYASDKSDMILGTSQGC